MVLCTFVLYKFTIVGDGLISRIQAVMDHYGLSISAFADAVGVQRSSISHLLNGRNRPSLDFVMKLIEAFPEVDLYWLLKGEGNFPQASEKAAAASPSTVPEPTVPSAPKTQVPATKKANNDPATDTVGIVVLYGDGTFRAFDRKKD